MGKIVLLLGPKFAGQEILKTRLIKEQHYNFHEIKKTIYSEKRIDEVGDHVVNQLQLDELIKRKQVVDVKENTVKRGLVIRFVNNEDIDLENNNYLDINTLDGLDQYVKYYGRDLLIPILIRSDRGKILQQLLGNKKERLNPDYTEICQGYLDDASEFSEENIAKRNIIDIVESTDDVENMLLQTKIILAKRLYK